MTEASERGRETAGWLTDCVGVALMLLGLCWGALFGYRCYEVSAEAEDLIQQQVAEWEKGRAAAQSHAGLPPPSSQELAEQRAEVMAEVRKRVEGRRDALFLMASPGVLVFFLGLSLYIWGTLLQRSAQRAIRPPSPPPA
jgi:hypothetical protein